MIFSQVFHWGKLKPNYWIIYFDTDFVDILSTPKKGGGVEGGLFIIFTSSPLSFPLHPPKVITASFSTETESPFSTGLMCLNALVYHQTEKYIKITCKISILRFLSISAGFISSININFDPFKSERQSLPLHQPHPLHSHPWLDSFWALFLSLDFHF